MSLKWYFLQTLEDVFEVTCPLLSHIYELPDWNAKVNCFSLNGKNIHVFKPQRKTLKLEV